MKISHDNKLIASGNNQRNILIYDSKSKEILNNGFYFHSQKFVILNY